MTMANVRDSRTWVGGRGKAIIQYRYYIHVKLIVCTTVGPLNLCEISSGLWSGYQMYTAVAAVHKLAAVSRLPKIYYMHCHAIIVLYYLCCVHTTTAKAIIIVAIINYNNNVMYA